MGILGVDSNLSFWWLRYLDLSDLDSECAERGLCTKSLLWRRVDVTGSRPGKILSYSNNDMMLSANVIQIRRVKF